MFSKKLYGELKFFVGKPERILQFIEMKEILQKLTAEKVDQVKIWLQENTDQQANPQESQVSQFRHWQQREGYFNTITHHLFLFANVYKDGVLVLGVYYKCDSLFFSAVGFFAALGNNLMNLLELR